MEHLTFKIDENVVKENVKFKNRFGITLAAHLYYPKMDLGKLRCFLIDYY